MPNAMRMILKIVSVVRLELYIRYDINLSTIQCITTFFVFKINHFRNTTKNLLNLNAGDHFQGSIWYTLFKADVVAEFASLMKHDVMAIGNHEFDDGSNEFKKFIDIVNDQMESNLTILSCNIEFLNGSVLNGLVEKSTIKVFENRSIAIIGNFYFFLLKKSQNKFNLIDEP